MAARLATDMDDDVPFPVGGSGNTRSDRTKLDYSRLDNTVLDQTRLN